MLAFNILLITSMDPLKYLMEKQIQDGKMVKWVLLLLKFDIKYVTQKSVKGGAIADQLAHCSPKKAKEIQGDFPDEDIMGIELESWKMYFNGVTNQNGSGIGVLLISPKGRHIPFSGRLNFPTNNNAIEYDACIMGLQAALGLGVRTILESEIPEVDWLQSRYEQICMMDEKRLEALYHIQGYQRRLKKAFDKKARGKDLKLGDLVLKEIRNLVQDTNGKFKQYWASPYIIK